MNPMDHVPAAMLDAMAREDAKEQRAWELEQAERAERAWWRRQEAERQERLFEYTHGHSSAEWQRAMAESRAAREARAQAAAAGVERAVLIDGELVERKAAVTAGDEAAAQLARARTGVRGREFMRQQVAELQRRQAQRDEEAIRRAIGRAERGEISR